MEADGGEFLITDEPANYMKAISIVMLKPIKILIVIASYQDYKN
jgi:hypothetical protein